MTEQRWATVRFVPGSATALVGRSFVALVASPPTGPLVESWKQTIEDKPAVATERLLTALHESARELLPPFALVLWDGDQIRLLIRGDLSVETVGGDTDAARTVSGADLLTWAEYAPTAARQVRLSLQGEDTVDFEGTLYTASLGVLPAVGVELSLQNDADASRAAPATRRAGQGPEGRPSGARTPQALAPVGPSPAIDEAEPIGVVGVPAQPAADADADAESGSEVEPDVDRAGGDDVVHDDPGHTLLGVPFERVAPVAPADGSVDVDPPPDLPPAGSTDDLAGNGMTGNYDDLFGSTMIRSVEAAAVRTGAAEDHDRPLPELDRGIGGEADDPAHDGMTIAVSDLRKLRGQIAGAGAQSTPVAALDGPSVLAVLCPDGHANAPHASECRVCAAPLMQQAPTMIPRPLIGRFVFDSGEKVDVDRTILIGRSPMVSGLVPDGHAPELVTVDSPNKDVSRTHLEVRIEGWSVLAIDQNSANGTMVTNPGRPAQRLRSGEPFLLGIGAVVRLADEVEFRMEAP